VRAEPMTDLERVVAELDALKACERAGIPAHFSPVLRYFRFVPGPERRACAGDFRRWADSLPADSVTRGYAIFLQAMDHFLDEENEASLRLLIASRDAFRSCDEADGLGLCAMLIGAVYRTFGNFDLALKTLWQGYELLKASGNYPILLAANANSLANIDFDLGHLDEALAMFKVTLDESARADDFYFMVYALIGLGRVHMRQGRPRDARDVFHRALGLAEEHGHASQTANSLTELATLAFDNGDLDDAASLNERALALRERHHLLGGAVTNCIKLAEIDERRSRWPEALRMLERGLAIAEETKVKPKLAQVHERLSRVQERMGDLPASLAHYKRFHALREEVEREDSARKLADAKLIFEAEETRKENVVIRAQKAEIERKNVELQDTIDELTRARIGRKAKAFTLGVAIVLFIFTDAILRTVLRVLASDNYLLVLVVKMAIIFSLAPINRGIENYLLRRVVRKGAPRAAEAQA
jgi:tetratricopeptide (TPR) repeat protein